MDERKCIACQSDWSRCYTYGTNIVWDFQIAERRLARERHWKYSREHTSIK